MERLKKNELTLWAREDSLLDTFLKRTADVSAELRIRHLGQLIVCLDIFLDGLAAT